MMSGSIFAFLNSDSTSPNERPIVQRRIPEHKLLQTRIKQRLVSKSRSSMEQDILYTRIVMREEARELNVTNLILNASFSAYTAFVELQRWYYTEIRRRWSVLLPIPTSLFVEGRSAEPFQYPIAHYRHVADRWSIKRFSWEQITRRS